MVMQMGIPTNVMPSLESDLTCVATGMEDNDVGGYYFSGHGGHECKIFKQKNILFLSSY